MADFATVEQLEARWRPLTATEKARAQILLGDASAQLRVECPGIDEKVEPVIPERVVCDMVKRAMLAAPDQPALSNFQETAGPFSQSGTFVNPTGDLYLTKGERRLLGCLKPRAFTVDLMPPVGEVPPWLGWMQ